MFGGTSSSESCSITRNTEVFEPVIPVLVLGASKALLAGLLSKISFRLWRVLYFRSLDFSGSALCLRGSLSGLEEFGGALLHFVVDFLVYPLCLLCFRAFAFWASFLFFSFSFELYLKKWLLSVSISGLSRKIDENGNPLVYRIIPTLFCHWIKYY